MNKKSLSVYFSESLISDFKTALSSDLRYRNTSHFFELKTIEYIHKRRKELESKYEVQELEMINSFSIEELNSYVLKNRKF